MIPEVLTDGFIQKCLYSLYPLTECWNHCDVFLKADRGILLCSHDQQLACSSMTVTYICSLAFRAAERQSRETTLTTAICSATGITYSTSQSCVHSLTRTHTYTCACAHTYTHIRASWHVHTLTRIKGGNLCWEYSTGTTFIISVCAKWNTQHHNRAHLYLITCTDVYRCRKLRTIPCYAQYFGYKPTCQGENRI